MKSGRSPLKQPPLHNPADSLLEQRDNLVYDKILYPAISSLFLLSITIYMWLFYLGLTKPAPYSFTIVTIIVFIASAIVIRNTIKRIRAHNHGIAAEKAVGQFLEQFRAQGYNVIHDIMVKTKETAFNIDHLLIGPKGIFTVETKYRKKPLRGACKVSYDGNQISINGQTPDRDPIAQAMGQAAWVRDYLKSCTALTAIPVTPLVVFPGWYIDYLQAGDSKVKVANEQLIWSCIQSSPHALASHDAKLIESRLTEYVQRQPF